MNRQSFMSQQAGSCRQMSRGSMGSNARQMNSGMYCSPQASVQSSCCRQPQSNPSGPAQQTPTPAAGTQTNGSSGIQNGYTPNDMPSGSRQQLLRYLNEVSFAACEAVLYLDTHPADQKALSLFKTNNEKRNAALKEYERLYGPLTTDCIKDSANKAWEWMQQPWPWEGGAC